MILWGGVSTVHVVWYYVVSFLHRSPRKLLGAGSKASEKVLSLSAEVATQKRHSRMEKVGFIDLVSATCLYVCLVPQVRTMWLSLEGFHDKSSQQREVVSSVLHGKVDEHTIDGKDIVFQVCL